MIIKDLDGVSYRLNKNFLIESDALAHNYGLRFVILSELKTAWKERKSTKVAVPVRYGKARLTPKVRYANPLQTRLANAIGCREFDAKTFSLIEKAVRATRARKYEVYA